MTALAYDALGGTALSAPVQVTVTQPAGRINVAAAANGGTAIGSSTYSSGYGAGGAINGDRKGSPWGSGGGWNDATPNSWPDWLEVDFAGSKTINEVDVFSVQDNYTSPVEPTAAMTFTSTGSLISRCSTGTDHNGWRCRVARSAATTLVWRQITFAALTTTKIRVFVTGAPVDVEPDYRGGSVFDGGRRRP